MFGLFESPKACQLCSTPFEKKKYYVFDSTFRGERTIGEKLNLCRPCFFSKVNESLEVYSFKDLAFDPLEDKYQDTYQFNKYSKLQEYNFDQAYIDSLDQIFETSPNYCESCSQGIPHFYCVTSTEEFGLDIMGFADRLPSGEWMCANCYYARFSEQVIQKGLYFKEYFPPVDANGMSSSWEH